MPTELASAYDRVAERYDSFYAAEEDESDAIFSRVVESEPGSLLDVGCGTGISIPYLKLPPSQYLGLDVSPEMVRVARESWPDYEFVCADFLEWEPDIRYDFVLSAFGPISHTEDLEGWVWKTKVSLRAGGRFLHMAADVDTVRILDDEGIHLPYVRWTPSQLGAAFANWFTDVRVSGWNRWQIVEGRA